jgi:hypothetical protein
VSVPHECGVKAQGAFTAAVGALLVTGLRALTNSSIVRKCSHLSREARALWA